MRLTDSRSSFVRLLEGKTNGLLRSFLIPLSAVYACLMRLRRSAYGAGILRSHRLSAPVISVGNLTTGGTGKTPMVEWVVRWLLKSGKKPAVLSRGYRAEGIGDDEGKNDETVMLERSLPNVPHYAHPDRVRSGRKAVSEGADCLVLDDGFQHIRVHRDVNLVLLDALEPFGGGVLPAGRLREPLSSLRAADAVILTRVDAIPREQLDHLRRRVSRLTNDLPIIETIHRPKRLITAEGTEAEPYGQINGRRVGIFCGLGNPRGFLKTVEMLGAEIVGAYFLPDHFGYPDKALAHIAEDFSRSDVEVVLTTEKDVVKIGERWPDSLPLRILRVEIAFTTGQNHLEEMLQNRLAQWRP